MGESRLIYIVSGPCGVGKSTTARELARMLDNTVLIEGDVLHDMFMEKDNPCWERRLEVTWQNILSLSRNFIKNNMDVVIDYVVENELEWFCDCIMDLDVKIKYIVLAAEGETIKSRLRNRGNEELIDRSLFLLNELSDKDTNKKYLFDIGNMSTQDITREILEEERFFLELLER